MRASIPVLAVVLLLAAGPTRAADRGEALYRKECGACHVAYPPGLLPAASWRRTLAGLDRHFGQSAELDAAEAAALERWLVARAAESGSHQKSARVLAGLEEPAPLRLS
jgi:mono/diheme cytochrome c family protein